MDQNSITKIKRNGETGSLCLIPQVLLKYPLGEPLSIIEKEGDARHSYPVYPFMRKPHTMKHKIHKFSVDSIKSLLQIRLEAKSTTHRVVEIFNHFMCKQRSVLDNTFDINFYNILQQEMGLK